jgi:plastocyanin
MSHRFAWLVIPIALLAASPGRPAPKAHRMVIVPEEDRFTPFSMTIRAGESVTWENDDTDDHTVVSDDAFNTAGNLGVNELLPGTDSNGGQPGTLTLRFTHPGTFVFYCRFHAHLDADNQPVAPVPTAASRTPLATSARR